MVLVRVVPWVDANWALLLQLKGLWVPFSSEGLVSFISMCLCLPHSLISPHRVQARAERDRCVTEDMGTLPRGEEVL